MREALYMNSGIFYARCGINPKVGEAFEAGCLSTLSPDQKMLRVISAHTASRKNGSWKEPQKKLKPDIAFPEDAYSPPQRGILTPGRCCFPPSQRPALRNV